MGENDFVQITALHQLVTRVNIIDSKVPNTNSVVPKTQMIGREKVIKRRLWILTRRYLKLVR